MGIIFAIIAGAIMSIQGVFNTRLSEKIGLLESNMFVQGTAFAIALVVMLIFGKGNLGGIMSVNKLYWLGGLLGMAITVTVMLSMQQLSPAVSVSAILISQLAVAAVIDYFGLFGTEQAPFGWNKFVGLGLLVGGILIFKMK